LPSRISWAVPLGVGVTGEMAATMVTVAPWATVKGLTAMLVVLGWLVAARVKEEVAERDD
jgi:hypothetical protein